MDDKWSRNNFCSQKSSRSRGFLGGSPCACEERTLDEETMRACVHVCVYYAIFFWPLAQIPGAARIRLSHNHLIGPNGATNQWAVVVGRQMGPQINGLLLRAANRSSGRVSALAALPYPAMPCPALPLPCLSPAPQGTGSDWKNLPGTAQFLST